MRPTDIPQIAEMSKPEKILFVEELWDVISSEEDIPVPESHKRELDKRFSMHQKSPGDMLTLQELQIRIENRK